MGGMPWLFFVVFRRIDDEVAVFQFPLFAEQHVAEETLQIHRFIIDAQGRVLSTLVSVQNAHGQVPERHIMRMEVRCAAFV